MQDAVGYRFGLQGGKNDLSVIHHQDRPCFSAESRVDKYIMFPRILDHTLYGSRFGTDNSHYFMAHNHISETDIYEIKVHVITVIQYFVFVREPFPVRF